MKRDNPDYNLFFKFIETFLPTGFKGIDPNHPLIQELEQMMHKKHQFFIIADVIELKILFTSKLSTQIIGIKPEELSPYHIMEATHPDDLERHSRGRAKLFKVANDLFIEKKGSGLLASDIRIRNGKGDYASTFFQCFQFYSDTPFKTTYLLEVHTDISGYKKNKNEYYYYAGNDISLFRYPDTELLSTGKIFTRREFEIIQLIESGLSSVDIAEKLFISINTVNTHRRNILAKAGKENISDLIYELKENGEM